MAERWPQRPLILVGDSGEQDPEIFATLARRVYVEGLVGPWILLDRGDALRGHAAFGFGLLGRSMTLGLEVGYLDPSAMLGLRLGFRF